MPAAPKWAGLLLAAALLAACKGEPEAIPGAPNEPVAAVEALADALRDGDLARYAALSLPPALHAQRAALWRQQMDAAPFADQANHERYASLMAEMLAPEAETALWAKAEPRLATMEQELGPRWTLGVTMLSGFASAAIASDERLSEAEKSHASGVLKAFAAWAGDQAAFTNREHARQALTIAVQTARELDLPTVDAMRALDYDPMLEKAGIAFRGAKAMAAVYGLDADAALGGIAAEVIQLEGARAVVRVRYPLLGDEVVFEQPMLQIDSGWYREDAVRDLEAALASAPAAPSPSAAVPTP